MDTRLTIGLIISFFLVASLSASTATSFMGPPTDIGLSNASIAENNDQNEFVGEFTVVDPDAGDTHTYSLVSGTGSDDNTSFIIVSNLLLAVDRFDFETRDSYSIRVRVTDNGGESFEKTFSIEITDANDRPTRISLNPSSFQETDQIGAVIGTLVVEDQDATDTYSFLTIVGPGSDQNDLVTINGDQLVTGQEIDYEDIQSLRVRVRVNDAGGLGHEQALIIPVINVVNETIGEITQNREDAKIKNFFTPNGDGFNDVWLIEDIRDTPNNRVRVYTQSGQLVLEVEDYQNDWDGQYEGSVLPSGTYYYEININEGERVIKGFLTLISERR